MRDLSSGAVINTNITEYQNHLRKRSAAKDLREQVKENADKINKIESDITDIKQMLMTLINKEQ